MDIFHPEKQPLLSRSPMIRSNPPRVFLHTLFGYEREESIVVRFLVEMAIEDLSLSMDTFHPERQPLLSRSPNIRSKIGKWKEKYDPSDEPIALVEGISPSMDMESGRMQNSNLREWRKATKSYRFKEINKRFAAKRYSGWSFWPRGYLLVILTVFSLLECFFRPYLAHSLPNYRWFCLQFGFIANFLFFSICLFVQIFSSRRKKLSESQKFTVDQLSDNHGQSFKKKSSDFIPLSKYIIMAMLDLFHQLMVFVPSGKLSGQTSIITPNLVVPLSLLLLYLTNRGSFSKSHLLGSVTMLIGMTFLWNDELRLKYACDDSEPYLAVRNLLLIAFSSLPALLSLMYKVNLLSSIETDFFVFNFIISLIQLIFAFLLAPIGIVTQYLLPGPSSFNPFELVQNFLDGLACVFTGVSVAKGDLCSVLPHWTLVISFIGYWIACLGLQVSIYFYLKQRLLAESGSEPFMPLEFDFDMLSNCQYASSALIAFLYIIPPVSRILFGICGSPSFFNISGVLIWIIGAIFSSRRIQSTTLVRLKKSIFRINSIFGNLCLLHK